MLARPFTGPSVVPACYRAGMAFQEGQTRKFRCTYSFPCGKYDRHCFEIVAVDAPDVPGRCNYSCDCMWCNPDLEIVAEAAAAT